jgi:hypothetical protein
MKKAEEYIDRISILPSNFKYMAERGEVNGNLLKQLNKLFREAQKDAYNHAIEDVESKIESEFDYWSEIPYEIREFIKGLKK